MVSAVKKQCVGSHTWVEKMGDKAHVCAEHHVAVQAEALRLASDVLGDGIAVEQCRCPRDVRLLESRGGWEGIFEITHNLFV